MINTSGKKYSSREHDKFMDADTVYRTEEAHYPARDFFFFFKHWYIQQESSTLH